MKRQPSSKAYGVISWAEGGYELVTRRRSGGQVSVDARQRAIVEKGDLAVNADAERCENIDGATAHLRRRVRTTVQGFKGERRRHRCVVTSEGASAVVEGVRGDASGKRLTLGGAW